MKVKSILKSVGMASVIALTVSSCSEFLDEGPKTALKESEIY